MRVQCSSLHTPWLGGIAVLLARARGSVEQGGLWGGKRGCVSSCDRSAWGWQLI